MDLASNSFRSALPRARSRRLEGNFFTEGLPERREIALIFDDGPGPIYTSKALDILAKYDILAFNCWIPVACVH